jgi:hypothetical protein
VKRVRSVPTSVRTSLSKLAGTSEPGRQSLQHLPAAGNSHAALVPFRWNGAVEVSVPADCLDAIRCLAQCVQHAEVEHSDAFQELVVSS